MRRFISVDPQPQLTSLMLDGSGTVHKDHNRGTCSVDHFLSPAGPWPIALRYGEHEVSSCCLNTTRSRCPRSFPAPGTQLSPHHSASSCVHRLHSLEQFSGSLCFSVLTQKGDSTFLPAAFGVLIDIACMCVCVCVNASHRLGTQ